MAAKATRLTFFAHCKTQRIACISYRKHPGPDWDPAEFSPITTPSPGHEGSIVLVCLNGLRILTFRRKKQEPPP